MGPAEALKEWREFYLLVGTAAPDVLAGSLLLLTIVNIRNVWDLMLTMVRRHREP